LYPVFEKQPQEKKELIIKVALEEFVQNGYEKASTDLITSRAGISKGILFHYFKSKKNLYLYLVHYAWDLLTEKSLESVQEIKSDDFFERIKEVVLLKQKVSIPYMLETQFLMDASTNPPVAVKEEMSILLKKHYETFHEDYLLDHVFRKELIQKDKLREDISVDTVIKMTMFIIEQMTNKYQLLYKNKQFDYFNNPDVMTQELNDYLKIVKYGVYKPEYS
jgi:TetR/AcrR family transcriptional regulator